MDISLLGFAELAFRIMYYENSRTSKTVVYGLTEIN